MHQQRERQQQVGALLQRQVVHGDGLQEGLRAL